MYLAVVSSKLVVSSNNSKELHGRIIRTPVISSTILEDGKTGRRGLLLSYTATTIVGAALAVDATDSKTALLQKYLKKSEENKEKNDKERMDDYYKRNYKDYFGFMEGTLRGKDEQQLSESEKVYTSHSYGVHMVSEPLGNGSWCLVFFILSCVFLLCFYLLLMADTDVNGNSQYEYNDDPLYLSSSDQPFLQLLNYMFDGTNFVGWKRDIYIALLSKNKEGFLDGSVKIVDKKDKKYHQFVRCDIMVLKWILNTIDTEIRNTVSYCTSSKNLWDELIERYGQTNSVEIYQLRKELNAMSQHNSSLIEYYSSLKRTWENLDSLDPVPSCTCGALNSCTCQLLKRILDRDMQAKLIKFLMGLSHTYEGVKSNILSLEPLPPLNKALALLQKIECQKQISEVADIVTEAHAYAITKSQENESESLKPGSSKHCTHCNKDGHSIEDCYRLKTCTFCKKKGHVQSICYLYKRENGQNRSSRGRGRGTYKNNNQGQRRVYNAEAVIGDEDSFDTPFDDAGFGHLDFGFVSGIVDSVTKNVLKQIHGHQQLHPQSQHQVMNAISSYSPPVQSLGTSNFAGPFK